ncbi:MAG TPA: Ig-like domain repeat protein, partial [Thermoanaerobaculia bacterium]|nr:Ig-like domain repeat protein [Thermoanaerobaculia bacterium]
MRTLAASLLLLTAAFAAGAQPVIDGTVGVGEYTYNSGDWSMAWDDTGIYVAKTNVTPGYGVAVTLDVDPQPTPAGGTSANGVRYLSVFNLRVPFRSDGGSVEYPVGDVSTIEMQLTWASLGLDSRPPAFNWLGFEHHPNTSGTAGHMPAANAAHGTKLPYFFAVTTDPPTDPFTNRQSTWDVEDKFWEEVIPEEVGARALREAIAAANADTESTRRYIVFDLEDPTFAITTALPTITRTTTIDATTQPGFAGTPVVGITGPGAGSGVDGISILGIPSSGCEIRGLNLGGFARAIYIYESNETKIYGNYIGTNLAGTAAVPNGLGIQNTLTFDSIIGAEGLGNLISGNTGDGIAADSSSRTIINGNLIGVAADGTTPLPNGGDGIQSEGNVYTYVGDPEVPNVIANNGGGINVLIFPNIAIRGNSIYANPITIANPQPTPTIHNASVGDGTSLVIDVSASSNNFVWEATAYRFDLYRYDDGPKTWLAASPCFNGPSLSNLPWHVGTGYSTSESYVLTVTSYRDACVVVADGTSLPTAPFSPNAGTPTTTTLQVSDTTPVTGSHITVTATVTGSKPRTGTVSFFLDGQQVCGPQTLDTNNQVFCTVRIDNDGEQEITAEYSGDAYNQPSEDSETITAFTNTFTGTGGFFDGERWSNGAPPMAFENFIIDGTATFTNSGVPTQYGSMTLATGAVLRWTQNHVTALRVTSIAATGPATIDMTPGGYLVVGTFNAANVTLVRGFGTVSIGGDTIPSFEYYNLNVTGIAVSAGPITVWNDLSVANSFTPTHTVSVYGEISTAGTLQFATLVIPPGGDVFARDSFSAATIDVAGSFHPDPDVVITGALTGTGTVKVTSTTTPNSFGSQYIGAKTLTNLTIELAGAAQQSVDALDYGNLTINNGLFYGVTLAGQTDVFGTLNLTLGNVHVGDGGAAPLVAHGNVFQTNLSWVVGTSGIARYVPAGTTSVLFPVGVEAGLAPITVTFQDIAAPGFVTMAAHTAATFGSIISGSGIDPARDANVYWFMTHALTASGYGVSATFTGLNDNAAIPYNFVVRAKKGIGT